MIDNQIAERNLAYGMLWLMHLDRRDPNLDLARRARALLFQGMTKADQRDGINRAIALIPEAQREAVRALQIEVS